MIYDLSYNSAHRIVADTLVQELFYIKRNDVNKGDIRAQTAEYWNGIFHCYGNLIGIFLTPVSENQTRVEVQTAYVQLGADLACKDKERKITEAISQRLRKESAPAPIYSRSMPSVTPFASAQPEVLRVRFKELADQLTVGIKENHISRLAVLPMADAAQKTNTPLGNYLTERVTNELYKPGGVKIVERSQLQRVLDELNLTMRGNFDEASVKKIGRMLGVDALLMGTYAELGSDTVELNSRIVTVETAEIMGVGTIQIPRSSVERLVR
ncbi:MAG TPA: FlgO family outer membrane protein [Nitrospira sp.]|nr:FlgO family outer membrane protein [Nitrospira sp.]